MLEWILSKIGVYTKNWVDSAQDMTYWRALRVPHAMELVIFYSFDRKNNLEVPQITRNLTY